MFLLNNIFYVIILFSPIIIYNWFIMNKNKCIIIMYC